MADTTPQEASLEAEKYAADPAHFHDMAAPIRNAYRAGWEAAKRSAQRSEVTEAMLHAALDAWEGEKAISYNADHPWVKRMKAALEAALAVANHAEQGNTEEQEGTAGRVE